MEILRKILKKFGRSSKVEKAKTIDRVAIFGSAQAEPSDKLYQEAYQVAFDLAKAGYIVINGGGPGVMKATSLGAKAAGGKVIGVTFPPPEIKLSHFEGRDSTNPIDEEIKSENYIERTLSLMKEGQVYVVFNGASGTMSEFAMAWGLARLYFGHHKPLILYGKCWEGIMKALKKNLLLRPEEIKVYKIVDRSQKVLRAIKEFEKETSE